MAGKGKRIHVVPNTNGKGWRVKPEGQRASKITDTQKEAMDITRGILNNASGGGEMIVHGRDNKIREGRTINRHDPHPPKG